MADTRITIDAQIQMRHDTEANWMAADPVLRVGEPAYTIGMPDRFKIGDGQRKWSELPYLTMLEEDPEGPALPALGELADVEIEQPGEGQALVYDEVRGMWVNRAVSAPDDEPESGLVFEFVYDSATNKATAEMVAALAEAIAADKLILCEGRTYKFILEQDEMYGLVSDTYLDIMDGKLKASVLAVMSSSYDVQLAEQEVPTGTEITEATISGWGFTKNAGTITGIKMNGATKGTSGVVDLGNVLTEHQQLKTINGQSIVGEGNITIQGGGATPRVEMTAESAAIEPNKFYVWPMMDSLDLTLGAEQSGVMNRYLFQFRNPKAGLTMLTLPDDITWSEDTELDENGLPVMEAAAFYRIEIIEGLASLKKWKLVYINFADAEVERVLMSNGVGDGIGITKRDAKAVTSIGTWFKGNTIIASFEEIKYFGLEELQEGTFQNCTSLGGRIELPYATSFGRYVFQKTAITSLIAPNVNSARDYMCQNCSALVSVSIPNATAIPYVAFDGCTALKSIDTGRAVTNIYQSAFQNCSSLGGDMYFPVVISIARKAFYKTAITSFNAPNLTTLADEIWSGCASLVSVSLPKATQIPYASFLSCTALQSIDTGQEVVSVGQNAFQNCTSLGGDMDFPKATELGARAFYKTAITSLNAPLATNIKDQVCDLCTSLASVNLPLATIIPYRAFAGCTALQHFEVGENVTTIGQGAFLGCTALQQVVVKPVTPPTMSAQAFNSTNNCPIYVPDASVEAYKAATNWNTYASRIKGISEYTG